MEAIKKTRQSPQSLKNFPLGNALVSLGHLSEKQLEDALAEQKRTGHKLGEILIQNRLVTEEQVARVLAIQQNVPYVDLLKTEIPHETLSLLSESQYRKYKAIVIADKADTFAVGLADPTDLLSQDALAKLLGKPLEISVVAADQLNLVIDKIFIGAQDGQLDQYARAVESDIKSSIFDLSLAAVAVDDMEAPVMKLLQTIFKEAVQQRASDVHIEPQEKRLVVRYRIDGVLATQAEVDLKINPPLISKLKLMASLDIAEKRLPQDGRISMRQDARQLDIRLSTIPTEYGESAVMRMLVQGQGMKSLEALGMPEKILRQFLSAIASPNGIILSTGPTGSGKTTTLYGALTKLNSAGVKILTCEDPIEYRIGGISQVQVNEKVGLTFPRILRSFLRQDPDILLVGEIRDGETAEIAVRAAMTGHLVLSTLHTNDSMSTPARLVDMGVPGFIIASSLRAVLAQRLVRTICSECAADYTPHAQELIWVKVYFPDLNPEQKFKHGIGCRRCNNSGYFGRVGVFEILEMTQTLASALHRGNPVEFEQVAKAQIGNESLAHNALRLAFSGRTTVSEAMKNATIVE